MGPTAVRFSHAHGSPSRRRCSFATNTPMKKVSPVMTPAEKNAHDLHVALETTEAIKAA